MGDAVKWGVLGAAKFARQHMAPAIHAAQGAEFFALATSSPDKIAPFRAFNPNLKVHDSYEALLADVEVEAVYIPLPNHLHVEWAMKALEAGKHVLVEKPLGMTAADFDAVIAKRDETGLLAAEAYMIVHHPQWQRAKEMVQGGAIGELRHVDINFSYNNAEDTANIRNRSDSGGGAMPDIGVYIIGSARFVTGEEPVSVDYADIDFENGVDVYTRFAAQFPSFRYTGMVSMRLQPRQEAVFQGTKGIVRLTAPFNSSVFGEAQVRLETPDLNVMVERWPGHNQYKAQVENFCRTLREGTDYPCPLEFSRGTQEMIDMVFRTAERS